MKITTLRQLYEAANNRKAIIGPSRFFKNGPKAAAWIINMRARCVNDLMSQGIEIYKPKQKSKSNTPK